MLTFDAWQFPDGETHLPKRMQKGALRVDGRLTYQYPLYETALKSVRSRGVAVDVGAHVGLFSFWMVRDFAEVAAFEPVAAHRECWRANVPKRAQDALYGCALGAKDGSVRLEPRDASSSGGTQIVGQGDIPMHTLDSFGLRAVDLLKIDCEGFEFDVLQGAAETVDRCHPVVIVEQRPKLVGTFGHSHKAAVDWLVKRGGQVVQSDGRDYVVRFPRA